MAASSCLLTRLLHDSCGGNTRTVLIATISSMQKDAKATLHTLQLGRQALTINDRPKYNYACRRESPRMEKGKSRSGQSISLVHRFSKRARRMVDYSPRAPQDGRVVMWKTNLRP